MKKCFVSDIKMMPIGSKISLKGWIYRKRDIGGKIFILMRDSTGDIQVVFNEQNTSPDIIENARKMLIESSLEIEGELQKDSRAPDGVEIKGTALNPVCVGEDFPIQEDSGEEFLLDKRHLWIRSRKLTNVMKIKEDVLFLVREYFRNEGFHEITPPVITVAAVEGGSTLFPVKYFDKTVYLSQSAQLVLEAVISSLENVWSLTPSFRAEKSRTRRHLTEYYHLEAEAAWMDFHDIMKLQEELTAHICNGIVKMDKDILSFFRDDFTSLECVPPFEKLTYNTCISLLNEQGIDIESGDKLGADEEFALSQFMETFFFITCPPKNITAFYTKENPHDPTTALSADLCAPEGIGEITTGGQREEDIGVLLECIHQEGGNPEDYGWYLDLRRYGSVPHSGFGMGIERLIRFICKLNHIRDATVFPRTPSRYYP
jgi:asparaginyl-tRNA synthetase